jgi:hypothetical protein
LANVLVFHEFEASPELLKAWVEDIQTFFADQRMAPVWGSVGGENGQKTTKLIKAKSVFKKLERHDYQGFDGMILMNTPTEDPKNTFQYSMFAWIELKPEINRPSFVLVYDAALEGFEALWGGKTFEAFCSALESRVRLCFSATF